MKVTLDLDRLLRDGSITADEHTRLQGLAKSSTDVLAFNILIGFGVVAVSVSALAWVPSPVTAVVLGVLVLGAGLWLTRGFPVSWKLLANICALVGALMSGLGIVLAFKGSIAALLAVAALFGVTAVFDGSALLAVVATLTLAASTGASTGYYHAHYGLFVEQPLIMVVVFTVVAIVCYQLSRRLVAERARLALAAARTSVFLVNFGFWVGSLWGDRLSALWGRKFGPGAVTVPDTVFAGLWLMALLAVAIWAWRRNLRWTLNTVATFAGIHFYTQWFEHLGATPWTVFVAGILALAVAVGLGKLNLHMKQKVPRQQA